MLTKLKDTAMQAFLYAMSIHLGQAQVCKELVCTDILKVLLA